MSLHMLGALDTASDVMDQIVHPLGKGVLSIFSPALAQSVEDVEVSEGWYNTPAMRAAKAASAADQAKLAAAIAADANAVQAATSALLSTSLAATAPAGKAKKAADARAKADQTAGDAALAAQDTAAALVPAALNDARAVPIQKGLAAATAKLQKASSDPYAQSAVKAWQLVLGKVLSASTPKVSPDVKGVGMKTERTMSLHMLGAHHARSMVGFDWGATAGGLLSTAGIVAKSVSDDQDVAKATAADKAKSDAAIAADSAAALAKAAALTSAALAASATGKTQSTAQAKASADSSALDLASSQQDQAGVAVPAAAMPLRLAAAQKALAAATAKLQAAPTDSYSQNLVKAWQWVLTKIQNAQITSNAPEKGKAPKSEESFFSKKIIGPVTVGYAAAGVGVIGVLWFAVKKGIFHRFGIG